MRGKQDTGVLVTLVERKSRFYLVKRVQSKHAEVVRDAIIEMLDPYREHVHTITFDNGGEFAEHKAIRESAGGQGLFYPPVLLVGAHSEREQQWTATTVHPEGDRPARGDGRGDKASGAVAQPAASEMSWIQAAWQGIRRVP